MEMEQVHRALAGTGHVIFGSFLHIEPALCSFCILIIIGAVVIFETISHALHHACHGTKFELNVKTIETELMIVGCTAFLFKVLVSVWQGIPTDWFIGLEFADILVPFFSIFNALLGLLLVFMAVRQTHRWNRVYNLNSEEIIAPYYASLEGISSWFGFLDSSKSDLELRTLEVIFRRKYNLRYTDKFAFDKYLEFTLDKFIRGSISMNRFNRFFGLVLLCAYMLRPDAFHIPLAGQCDKYENYESTDYASKSTYPDSSYGGSSGSSTDGYRLQRQLAGGSAKDENLGGVNEKYFRCIEDQQMFNFVYAGVFIVAFTAFAYILSRRTIYAILQTEKCDSPEEWVRCIEAFNINDGSAQMNPTKESKASSNKTLQRVLRIAKKRQEVAETKKWLNIASKKITNGVVFYMDYVLFFFFSLQSWGGFGSIAGGGGEENNHAKAKKYEEENKIGSPNEAEVQGKEREKEKEGINANENMSFKSKSTVSPDFSGKVYPGPHIDGFTSGSASCPNLVLNLPVGSDKDKSNSFQDRSNNNRVRRKSIAETMEERQHRQEELMSLGAGLANIINSNSPSSSNASSPTNNGSSLAVSRTSSSVKMVNLMPILLHAKTKFKRLLKDNPDTDCIDNDFTGIFLMKSVDLYFTVIQWLMMLISLYNAMFLANFANYSSPNYLKWLCAFMGVSSCVLYMYVFQNSNLILAMYQVNYEALVETLSALEDAELLFMTLKNKLLERMQQENPSGDPHEGLAKVFEAIDNNGNSKLSRTEFKILLNALGVHLNNQKWHYLFQKIDVNGDNEISLHEFILFIDPNNTKANEAEFLRIQRLRDANQYRSKKFAQKQNSPSPATAISGGMVRFISNVGFTDVNANTYGLPPNLELPGYESDISNSSDEDKKGGNFDAGNFDAGTESFDAENFDGGTMANNLDMMDDDASFIQMPSLGDGMSHVVPGDGYADDGGVNV